MATRVRTPVAWVPTARCRRFRSPWSTRPSRKSCAPPSKAWPSKVIEFNARFGDPETEVVLPKLTSDLGAGISAILDGETPEFTWDESNATLGVVIASNGYPENVIKGARVPEIEVDEDSHVYYAGVASDEHGNLVANSGRVLLVETSAPDIKSAQDKVYAIIDKLELRGLFYRHDIGFKALK